MTPAMTIAGPVPQAAAICFRPLPGKKAEILLITSRSGEWAIPKGRIDPGFTPPQAAANEALEEAGVRGQVLQDAVGAFEYLKRGGWALRAGTRCRVQVFPLLVSDLLEEWLEADFRKRRWVPAAQAAGQVAQPGLSQILDEFPAWLRSVRSEPRA
jgi:8-oxo-dGTP pyrophosphatase MutT (NUDIX family)